MQRIGGARDQLFGLQELIGQSLAHRAAYPRLNPGLEGIELCTHYSVNFQETVRSVYKIVARDLLALPVAIAVYGSPSRHEMAGESDADILIVSRGTSAAEQEFRGRFASVLAPFEFAKIDIPRWGALHELKMLTAVNIAEGNQVLEAMPIAGDPFIIRQLQAIQRSESTLERSLRNLVFQSYCFTSYYENRQKPGMINIKYSHGGTRDLLFFIWIAKLEAQMRGDPMPIATISWAIDYLVGRTLISSSRAAELRTACSNMMLLRSEVLRLNKDTALKGLSFLDPYSRALFQFSNPVRRVFRTPAALKVGIVRDQTSIHRAKTALLEQVLRRYVRPEEYAFWDTVQTRAVTTVLLERGLAARSQLIRVMSIWEIGKRSYVQKLHVALERLIAAGGFSWDIAASLLSLRDLEEEYVDLIGAEIINKTGYGYLMRMIAQHPHVSRATLEDICRSHTDKRYTDLARIALARGRREANFQV